MIIYKGFWNKISLLNLAYIEINSDEFKTYIVSLS